MEPPLYVLLAAGASRRMGFDKAFAPFDGETLFARAVAALGGRDCIAVVPSRYAKAAAACAPHARVACNDEPERGMTRSLHLALAMLPRDRAFGVLPVDLPEMQRQTIEATEALLTDGVDVAYPVDASGRPGHPVLFGATARVVVDALEEGDTLRRARDDAALRRATWLCRDRSAFYDLDEPAEWDAATRSRDRST